MNPVILATRTTSTGVLIEISANDTNMLGRADGGEWQQIGRIPQVGAIGGRLGQYAVLMTEIEIALKEVKRLQAESITPEMIASSARYDAARKLSADMDRADSIN